MTMRCFWSALLVMDKTRTPRGKHVKNYFYTPPQQLATLFFTFWDMNKMHIKMNRAIKPVNDLVLAKASA
jgi:hypothetical protein